MILYITTKTRAGDDVMEYVMTGNKEKKRRKKKIPEVMSVVVAVEDTTPPPPPPTTTTTTTAKGVAVKVIMAQRQYTILSLFPPWSSSSSYY